MYSSIQAQLEDIRRKLAGNQEFHTRLAYQKMDPRKASEVRAEDLIHFVSEPGRNLLHNITLEHAEDFLRKYTMTGILNYDEFLKILAPKTNKALAQRMLIRSPKRGVQMPNYLSQCFRELIYTYIRMSQITQTVRKRVQSSGALNHLEMVQFFRRCLNSNGKVLTFINMTAGASEFILDDMTYLSCHIRSGNSIEEFDDEDIKELLCPLDMNFQKPQTRPYKTQTSYHHNFLTHSQTNKTTMNFLNKTYQKTTPNFYVQNLTGRQPVAEEFRMRPNIKINQTKSDNNNDIERKSFVNSQHGHMNGQLSPRLYIDQFIKPVDEGIQLDQYLNRVPNYMSRNKPIQRFEDHLPGSGISSSRSSAFQQYGVAP